MKIAVAASGLGHIARGVEAWAADLGRALADRGEDVRLYRGAGWPEAPYERLVACWQQGQPRTKRLVRCLPSRGMWRLGLGTPHQVEQTTFALGLIRRLRRERVDVLHVQDANVARIVQRARRLGLVRTATILAHGTEESLDFLSRIQFLQHLAPWHLEQARAAGVWKPSWTAIPNFIDTNLFRPGPSAAVRAELGLSPADPVVLTVAAVKRTHKRIDYLIDEFARLLADAPGPRPTLVVAGGRTPDTADLVAHGHRALGDRVRFLIDYPRDRMPALYRAADVFVLASLFEMMPLAVLEATASGLPCLVNDHPVLAWMAGPGGRPRRLDEPGALAAGLRTVLTDAGLRSHLGRAARDHCVAMFGRDRVVSQILDYYRAVTAHTRRRSAVVGGAR
jgi:1,2-diacylglycerol 3-alpha-glucosyltransferase